MKRTPPDGSATVEAVILAPLMAMFVMLIVHVHRQTDAAITVARAADAGARAASMSASSSMTSNGIRAARAELNVTRRLCVRVSVHVDRSREEGLDSVSVTVTCVTNADGLGLLAVKPGVIRKTSREVIDLYRGR